MSDDPTRLDREDLCTENPRRPYSSLTVEEVDAEIRVQRRALGAAVEEWDAIVASARVDALLDRRLELRTTGRA